MEFTTTTTIASDAGTVWEVLSDPEKWPDWMPDIKDVQPKAPGTAARYGSEYKVKQAWWKMNDQEVQIREFEPLKRFVYAATTMGGSVQFAYDIREVGPGQVAVDHELSMTDAFAKLNGWMGGPFLENQLVKEATALRDHCEARAPQDVVDR